MGTMRDEFVKAMREVITRLHLEKKEDMRAKDIADAKDLIRSGIGSWKIEDGQTYWSL